MALPARALIFSLGIGSLRPVRPPPCTEAAIPSPRSALGFRGLYVLVHIIRLPVILIWTSSRGGRCFSWDVLCGPAGRQSDGSQWIHPVLFPKPECPPWVPNPEATKQPEGKAALDGVSVMALGFDRFVPPGEQKECDSIHAAGWAVCPGGPNLKKPWLLRVISAWFKASVAVDALEASPWNQLAWLQRSPPWPGPPRPEPITSCPLSSQARPL